MEDRSELEPRVRAGRRRSLLSNPPRIPWKLETEKHFACFISHYKVEAGMEARYLRELLERMLGRKVFLDSSDLRDLKYLVSRGIARSQCLLITQFFLRGN